MISDAFAQYQKSVSDYGYEQYHNGDSYDLEALRQVLPNEAEQVIDQMELNSSPSWIDVEVLDTIGTDRCLKIIKTWAMKDRGFVQWQCNAVLHCDHAQENRLSYWGSTMRLHPQLNKLVVGHSCANAGQTTRTNLRTVRERILLPDRGILALLN